MSKLQRPIDLIEAGQKNKEVKVEFEIPAGDVKIKAVLIPIDFYAIQEAQRIVLDSKIVELSQEGYANKPILESRWNKKIKELEKANKERLDKAVTDEEVKASKEKYKRELETLESEKPENLAEQMAIDFAQYRTMQQVIPKYIRDENNELMFPTIEEQEKFRQIVCRDMSLLIIIANAYKELASKINEISEQIKNS